MSWSIHIKGTSVQIKTQIEKEFVDIQHLPPEEDAIKKACATVIERLFDSQDPNVPVAIDIAGSMSINTAQGSRPRHSLVFTITSV